MTNSNRNPVIIPGREDHRRRCAKCSGLNFSGRLVQGVVTFTCTDCGNKWYGGVGQEPHDPRIPIPVEPSPPVQQVAVRNRKGEIVGTEELSRKVDTTQEFRKGAPVPEGEDY